MVIRTRTNTQTSSAIDHALEARSAEMIKIAKNLTAWTTGKLFLPDRSRSSIGIVVRELEGLLLTLDPFSIDVTSSLRVPPPSFVEFEVLFQPYVWSGHTLIHAQFAIVP